MTFKKKKCSSAGDGNVSFWVNRHIGESVLSLGSVEVCTLRVLLFKYDFGNA